MKFALWIACASMGMIFAALSSAYTVRQAGGNWLEFPLPNIFFISTATIIASSLVLQASYSAYKKERVGMYKGLLLFSLFLGFAFIALQYQGWEALHDMGCSLEIESSWRFYLRYFWYSLSSYFWRNYCYVCYHNCSIFNSI